MNDRGVDSSPDPTARADQPRERQPRGNWQADRVRRLRRSLKLTQQAFAQQLGVRQQTVSEWETGAYEPRGASTRLLDIVAERAGFAYGSRHHDDGDPPAERS